MHYRHLGNTGIEVSEIGLGCNRIGESCLSDADWIGLLHRAADLGVTLYDTSSQYTKGRSEELIGRAFGNRAGIVIATKASHAPNPNGVPEYTAELVCRAAEMSLRTLRRDVIDVFQLHSPSRDEMERLDWAEGMARLKKQGKIRCRGVAVHTLDDALWLMERGTVDVLQITHNLFDRNMEPRGFEAAERCGVGLMCRMPLARGVLSGKFCAGERVAEGHRALLDGDRLAKNTERAETLRPPASRYEGGMARLALHFSLTPKAISAIIPGARSIGQLEQNAAASNGEGLPAQVLAQLESICGPWGGP